MAIATKELTSLVTQFRKAIDAAYAAGKFKNDILFKHFPNGCCGDAVVMRWICWASIFLETI